MLECKRAFTDLAELLPNSKATMTPEKLKHGADLVQGFIPSRMTRLEVISTVASTFVLPLTERVDGRTIPLSFLSTLKTIELVWDNDARGMLSARHVLWMLLFCKSSRQAAIACTSSPRDAHFLVDFASTFKGRSKVKHLAIKPVFIEQDNEEMCWWDLPEEQGKVCRGGNRFTESVYNFLQVTSNLSSLKISGLSQRSTSRSREASWRLGFFGALDKSYWSLKHLRLLTWAPIGEPISDSQSSNLSKF